jgi:hypothetical protein
MSDLGYKINNIKLIEFVAVLSFLGDMPNHNDPCLWCVISCGVAIMFYLT